MQSALRPEGMVARNTELKVFLHEKLLGMLNLSVLDKVTRADLGKQLAPLVRDLLSSENIALNASEYNQLVTEVLDEVLGLGPLEPSSPIAL
jgi:pilus assembly protein CpaF